MGEVRSVGHERTSCHILSYCPDCREPVLVGELCDPCPASTKHQVSKDYKSSWSLVSEDGKGAIDVVRAFGLYWKNRHTQRWGCRVELLHLWRMRGVGRIEENGDARGEFESFGHHADVEVR